MRVPLLLTTACTFGLRSAQDTDADLIADTDVGILDTGTADSDAIDSDPAADTDPLDTDSIADTDLFDTGPGIDTDLAPDTDTQDTDAAGDTDTSPADTGDSVRTETGVSTPNASDAALLDLCPVATTWTPRRFHLRSMVTCVLVPDGDPCPSIDDAVQRPDFGDFCSRDYLVCGMAYLYRHNRRNPADTDDTGNVPIETGWGFDTSWRRRDANDCCYSYVAEPGPSGCEG